jgi:hypothetical protein
MPNPCPYGCRYGLNPGDKDGIPRGLKKLKLPEIRLLVVKCYGYIDEIEASLTKTIEENEKLKKENETLKKENEEQVQEWITLGNKIDLCMRYYLRIKD